MAKGRVSKLQRYATKDGPGLRTTVFMTGCNLRCKWCANPEMLKPEGGMFYYKERCRHCGICVSMAAPGSIVFDDIGCRIDREHCGDLAAIQEACPFEAYEQTSQIMDHDTLVKKLLRDREFYEDSNGGVTFSGGEAGLQDEFLYACASALQKEHIHTALDTAGRLDSANLLKLMEVFDLVLYDIKAFDRTLHKQCTGVDNEQILENAKLLSKQSIPMIVRMIVVPGMNDDPKDITARLNFVKSLGSCVKQVDLLPYHNLGEGKYDKLGMSYELHDVGNMSDDRMEAIKLEGQALGLHVTIGG